MPELECPVEDCEYQGEGGLCKYGGIIHIYLDYTKYDGEDCEINCRERVY